MAEDVFSRPAARYEGGGPSRAAVGRELSDDEVGEEPGGLRVRLEDRLPDRLQDLRERRLPPLPCGLLAPALLLVLFSVPFVYALTVRRGPGVDAPG